MPLETRNVFIDTQSFVKAGLDFRAKAIHAFCDAAGNGKLRHLMTSISHQEVKDKIEDSIKEGLGRVQDFRRKAKILESSKDPTISGFFAIFDPIDVQRHAAEVFEAFISESKAEILDLSKVDSNEVFRNYFSQQPPFQAGKKKNEFPDAFSMMALAAEIGEERCYVVSEDTDLISFCEKNDRFLHVSELAKLLDILNSHDDDKTRAVKEYFAQHAEEIQQSITQRIEEAEFYNSSSWEDSEVTEHSVLQIGDFDPSIVAIDDESGLVQFDVDVDYEVVVKGPDFVNAIYDREDGRTFVFGKTKRSERSTKTFTVEVEFDLLIKEGNFVVEDRGVYVVGLSEGVEVSVEESRWE